MTKAVIIPRWFMSQQDIAQLKSMSRLAISSANAVLFVPKDRKAEAEIARLALLIREARD